MKIENYATLAPGHQMMVDAQIKGAPDLAIGGRLIGNGQERTITKIYYLVSHNLIVIETDWDGKPQKIGLSQLKKAIEDQKIKIKND